MNLTPVERQLPFNGDFPFCEAPLQDFWKRGKMQSCPHPITNGKEDPHESKGIE